MRKTRIGEGRELERRRGVEGERAPVRDRRLFRIRERRALSIERPFERAATRRLIRRRQPGRARQRRGDEPKRRPHCDVTAAGAVVGGALFSASGLAP